MESEWTKKELTRLAKKYGLRRTTIYMIVMSQFEGVKEVINMADEEKNYFPSVRLPLLALFKVNKKRLKYLDRKYYLREQRRIAINK